MKKWLLASWLFGFTPLILGISIFILWVLTRADWLMFAGYFVIWTGIVSVVISLVCLARSHLLAKKGGSVGQINYTMHYSGLILLIVANFIAAGACVVGVIAIETRYKITVTNLSSHQLQRVNISGGGINIDLDDIGSSQTETVSFWIQTDGELMLTATHGDESIDSVVDGYVTGSLGRDLYITFDESGQIQIGD